MNDCLASGLSHISGVKLVLISKASGSTLYNVTLIKIEECTTE